MSTTQSAARTVSSSCSTTISVFPQVTQPLKGFDQPQVVTLVQADAGLVQDIKHPDQSRADLRRQADALRLTTRQRPGGAGQRQVVQPHVQQET